MRTCANCGGDIQQLEHGRPRTYCSDKCRVAAANHVRRQLHPERIPDRVRRIGNETRVCKHCGGSFSPRVAAHYCSRSCKEKAKQARARAARAAAPKPCGQCGVPCRSPKTGLCGPCAKAPKRVTRSCDRCGADTLNKNWCSSTCRAEAIAERTKLQRKQARTSKLCAQCSAEFLPHRRDVIYCSIPCRKRRGMELAIERHGKPEFVWTEARQAVYQRRRARKKQAEVGESFTNADVFERDGWVCGLCSEPVDALLSYPDPMSKSLDHVVPLAHGGSHSRENVQLAHLVCNLRKGARIDAVA